MLKEENTKIQLTFLYEGLEEDHSEFLPCPGILDQSDNSDSKEIQVNTHQCFSLK